MYRFLIFPLVFLTALLILSPDCEAKKKKRHYGHPPVAQQAAEPPPEPAQPPGQVQARMQAPDSHRDFPPPPSQPAFPPPPGRETAAPGAPRQSPAAAFPSPPAQPGLQQYHYNQPPQGHPMPPNQPRTGQQQQQYQQYNTTPTAPTREPEVRLDVRRQKGELPRNRMLEENVLIIHD